MKPQLLRRIATALAALGMAWPAIAADMALKGPLLPPPAPVYGWGGYYFGGNMGYSWGKEDLNLNGFAVDGVWIPGNDFAALRPHGAIAGGQVGFNWQTGIVVFGLESDLQWKYQKDTVTSAGSFWTTDCFGDGYPPCLLAGTGTNTLTTKIDWFGTLRVRFGLRPISSFSVGWLMGAYKRRDLRLLTALSATPPAADLARSRVRRAAARLTPTRRPDSVGARAPASKPPCRLWAIGLGAPNTCSSISEPSPRQPRTVLRSRYLPLRSPNLRARAYGTARE